MSLDRNRMVSFRICVIVDTTFVILVFSDRNFVTWNWLLVMLLISVILNEVLLISNRMFFFFCSGGMSRALFAARLQGQANNRGLLQQSDG